MADADGLADGDEAAEVATALGAAAGTEVVGVAALPPPDEQAEATSATQPTRAVVTRTRRAGRAVEARNMGSRFVSASKVFTLPGGYATWRNDT